MSCCGNHCRTKIHNEFISYGKKFVKICDQNSDLQISCEITNPFEKLLSEKVNAPWKNEIPNNNRNPDNPNLWIINNFQENNNIKLIYIYILELENNKWYIGKTTNPQYRFENHLNSNGSSFTTLYKPIRLHNLISDCSDYDEDKYTLEYMNKYGIENVRGGSFCKLNLNKDEIIIIQKMLNSSTDKCYICGSTNHFAKDCDLKNINEIDKSDKLIFSCKYCNKEFQNNKSKTGHENLFCKNKPDKKGTSTPSHSASSILTSVASIATSIATIIDNTHDKSNTKSCFRCGRNNHYSKNCYASKHINGSVLN